MNIVIVGPEMWLEEWKSIAVSPDVEIFYSNVEGIQSWSLTPEAVVYLFPEQDDKTLAWLQQLPVSVCIVNAVIETTAITDKNFVRINGWPGFLGRSVAEVAGRKEVDKEKVEKLLKLMGREAEWVGDVCGLLTPRVVAAIINEAYFAMEDEVSEAGEIDTAMKMGTNYPYGPVEWGKKIGLERIFNLLQKLSVEQKRYTPSLRLKMEALA